ncbi:MAG TPA: matrixin family metalloprotease [Polyangiaceae bacterium]
MLKFPIGEPLRSDVAFRRNERFAFGSCMVLGLCAAVTLPARTSSAWVSTGGSSGTTGGAAGHGGTFDISTPSTSTAQGGRGGTSTKFAIGGTSSVSAGGTKSIGNTKSTSGASGQTNGKTSVGNGSVGGRGGTSLVIGGRGGTSTAATTTAFAGAAGNVVIPPLGVDTGTARPTWRETDVVLTVDPSYLALPYAKHALEAALEAWTSRADQLPHVTLRYVDNDVSDLTGDAAMADHRIFFVPASDKRAKGALAITLVTADEETHSILDADILVNGGHLFTDVDTLDAPLARASSYDLQDVIAHELGHWFGLNEDYENREATMYAYVYPAETKKRDLDVSDVTAVQLAYWQADNPSENTGCSIGGRPSAELGWVLGYLAAASLMLRSRNRRSTAHVLRQSRRHHC